MDKELNNILREAAEKVEPAIVEVLKEYVSKKNYRLLTYTIASGGKRIRPALAISSCRLLGGSIKDIIYPAAGLEILHNYSLIIDDMIDNSELRRGKPTAWINFGRSIAHCIGMDYAASIFGAANKSKYPNEISQTFIRTLKILVDGEILDILFEQSGREDEPFIARNRYYNIKKNDFIEMISGKTASLVQASCEVGGICAGASEKEIEYLKRYGFNLGMAFQISDDILDIFGEEAKFGKKIGKDIEERKGGNAVIYFASQEFSPEDRKMFWSIMRKKKVSKGDVILAINLIKRTKAREMAVEYGNHFVKEAIKNLSHLPKNKWNDSLKRVAELLMEREK